MAKLRDLTKENAKEVLETAKKIYPVKIKSDLLGFETINGLVPYTALDDESKDQIIASLKARLLTETINMYQRLKEDGQPSKLIEIEVAKIIATDCELNAIVEDSLEGIESDLI